MRREDQLILELCRANCDGESIRSLLQQSPIDWEYFLSNGKSHEVAALVLSRLLNHPIPPDAQDILKLAAKKEMIEVTVTRATMRAELSKVKAVLEREGIEFLLLKGLSLDFSGVRTTKDLDILVRENRFIEAIRALATIGYEYVGQYRTSYLKRSESRMLQEAIRDTSLVGDKLSPVVSALRWNNHYETVNRETDLLVEVHSHLFHRRRAYTENIDTLLDNIDNFWDEKQFDPGLNCYTLSPEHALLVMAVHMAIKRSPSNNTFRLKVACDIDNLIGRGIDWQHFGDAACAMKVTPFALYALLQTRQLLGTSVDDGCLERLEQNCTQAQRFLTRVHLKCLRSLNSYRFFHSKMYMVLKPFVFETSFETRLKWLLLIPVLFPSREKMAGVFNIREDSPFLYVTYILNPFRWVILFIRSVISARNSS